MGPLEEAEQAKKQEGYTSVKQFCEVIKILTAPLPIKILCHILSELKHREVDIEQTLMTNFLDNWKK